MQLSMDLLKCDALKRATMTSVEESPRLEWVAFPANILAASLITLSQSTVTLTSTWDKCYDF
jgi:hypothetical protein